jgi:hypothetical protein
VLEQVHELVREHDLAPEVAPQERRHHAGQEGGLGVAHDVEGAIRRVVEARDLLAHDRDELVHQVAVTGPQAHGREGPLVASDLIVAPLAGDRAPNHHLELRGCDHPRVDRKLRLDAAHGRRPRDDPVEGLRPELAVPYHRVGAPARA